MGNTKKCSIRPTMLGTEPFVGLNIEKREKI